MKYIQLRSFYFLFGCICTVIILAACNKTEDDTQVIDPLAALNLPATPFTYANQSLPAHLLIPEITALDNTPANNAITDWGATLGRVLFYDVSLSANNKISCSSCHNQAFGFSDTAKLSKGFLGGSTGRHSMSLINAKYYPRGRFFWDERAPNLEAQVLIPLQDAVEMGMNLDTLYKKLNATTHYPYLFEKAFGDKTLNSTRISRALAQFIRSIVSYQTKFDLGRAQVLPGQNPFVTPYANFTAQENQGKQLFFSGVTACSSCHGTETLTAPGDRNNGIENPSADRGVGGVTGNSVQVGNFKVPSLKNIELRAPYMHDGRFNSLEAVIEHYNSGIQPNPNLAPQLKNPDGTPKRLNLSSQQKESLVAFLKTLTDRSLQTDEKYTNPFKK